MWTINKGTNGIDSKVSQNERIIYICFSYCFTVYTIDVLVNIMYQFLKMWFADFSVFFSSEKMRSMITVQANAV